MLEEKIEDLKQEANNIQDTTEGSPSKAKIQTVIELALSVGIPDSFFLSETDKLHFYREIEMIEDIEDLVYLKESFFENMQENISLPEETENLFLLLETQIFARGYSVTAIRRV